jgi:hypothetical protein
MNIGKDHGPKRPFSIKAKNRPKSKAAGRVELPTEKAKFKVKVERQVDLNSIIKCKNNQKLKLSAIVCPDEKSDRIKRLEKRLDFEKPLMDRGIQPGSQKSLFPSRKTEQELMIFKEIFVEPKEKELEKIKERAKMEKDIYEQKLVTYNSKKKPSPKALKVAKNVDLNHSNMLNSSGHQTKKGLIENYLKSQEELSSSEEEEEEKFRSTFTAGFRPKEEINILSELIMENTDNLIGIVLKKFNYRRNTSGNASFFVQQIHVQPPEGLNATASSPLTPGSGWAPSIPHNNPNLNKTSIKDMTIRAKAGVQSGDVQKEAHMAYNLAILNEEKKNLKKAIRFYKRFFF